MADKKFTFEGRTVSITDPAKIAFQSSFIEELYWFLFDHLNGGTPYKPQIDVDGLGTYHNPSIDVVASALKHGEKGIKAPTRKNSDHKPHGLGTEFCFYATARQAGVGISRTSYILAPIRMSTRIGVEPETQGISFTGLKPKSSEYRIK